MIPLSIVERSTTFVVRGNAWPVLTAVGIKPFYCGGQAMGFVVDAHRLPDLLAYLDARRLPYRLQREVAA